MYQTDLAFRWAVICMFVEAQKNVLLGCGFFLAYKDWGGGGEELMNQSPPARFFSVCFLFCFLGRDQLSHPSFTFVGQDQSTVAQ